jgi:hypothetical protein
MDVPYRDVTMVSQSQNYRVFALTEAGFDEYAWDDAANTLFFVNSYRDLFEYGHATGISVDANQDIVYISTLNGLYQVDRNLGTGGFDAATAIDDTRAYTDVDVPRGDVRLPGDAGSPAIVWAVADGDPVTTVVDLAASADQWIWSNTPDTARTADAVSVRGFSGDTRIGLIQFDLSGVLAANGVTADQLYRVELDLNSRDDYDDAGQNAYLLDLSASASGVANTMGAITWNGFMDAVANDAGYSLVDLTMLGESADGNALSDGEIYTTLASVFDTDQIKAILDGVANGLVTFAFVPLDDTTNVDWADGPSQLDNNPAHLRLCFDATLAAALPEPVSAMMLGLAGLCVMRRRRVRR